MHKYFMAPPEVVAPGSFVGSGSLVYRLREAEIDKHLYSKKENFLFFYANWDGGGRFLRRVHWNN
jgi:hypothetical protein